MDKGETDNSSEFTIPSTSGTITPLPTPIAGFANITDPPATIETHINTLTLATDGDSNEQQFWPHLNDQFPNYEVFWRDIVTPMTRRIELPLGASRRHERRGGIAEDVWEISYINYSVFLNLVGAFQHLQQPVMFSLGNFYTHLATACELAE